MLLDEVECVGRAGGGGQDEEKGQRKGSFDSEARLGKTHSLAGLTPTALSMSFPLAFSKMKCDRFVLPRPIRPLNTRQSQ